MAKYINADMAIEKLSCINPTEPTIWYSDAVEAINNTPAADVVERKTGKWEEREVLSKKVIEEWQSARCSVCGKYHTTPYMYYFDNYSFCPSCGSRMER